MIFRSLFTWTLIITLFVHTLNAINPAYHREGYHEELADISSNEMDDEPATMVIKQTNDDDDNEDYRIKRNRYPKFYFSPLWLSRRTRTNRFYGKPLWISRSGR